eukprot:GHVP01069959.1.p1 GENE.GHVP01069959.1~~GHVP01069959.1.p1  ORF type:complete len:170 (-),score=17.11 GHVP01069959.1:40-510(-)
MGALVIGFHHYRRTIPPENKLPEVKLGSSYKIIFQNKAEIGLLKNWLKNTYKIVWHGCGNSQNCPEVTILYTKNCGSEDPEPTIRSVGNCGSVEIKKHAIFDGWRRSLVHGAESISDDWSSGLTEKEQDIWSDFQSLVKFHWNRMQEEKSLKIFTI